MITMIHSISKDQIDQIMEQILTDHQNLHPGKRVTIKEDPDPSTVDFCGYISKSFIATISVEDIPAEEDLAAVES